MSGLEGKAVCTSKAIYIYIPKGSVYGIFPYIYHKNQPNVRKYTSPMDAMGLPI